MKTKTETKFRKIFQKPHFFKINDSMRYILTDSTINNLSEYLKLGAKIYTRNFRNFATKLQLSTHLKPKIYLLSHTCVCMAAATRHTT